MTAARAVGFGAILMFILLAAACSKEDQQDLLAGIGSQAVVEGANDAFSDAGIEVDGEMDCAGDVQGDTLSVHCTGTSIDGQSLELDGELVAANDNEIVGSGTFTGKADGEEVFSVDCIGETCDMG
jgi:hypothetical protein